MLRRRTRDPVERARRAGERLYRFDGGLRLRHHKKMSCEVPVQRAALPQRLYVPLHFRGAPIALVTAGLMALAFMGFTGLAKL